MQATGNLREVSFSKGFILVVLAMVCALVLGAAAGYAARSAGSAAGTTLVHAQPKVDAIQGGPQSDLTRALPTAAPGPAAGYDTSPITDSNQPQPSYGAIP
jgi:hypothetical protein